MAANLRDFVLTNCDGKEVYDSLMQLHSVSIIGGVLFI
jgi:hypothetical protein